MKLHVFFQESVFHLRDLRRLELQPWWGFMLSQGFWLFQNRETRIRIFRSVHGKSFKTQYGFETNRLDKSPAGLSLVFLQMKLWNWNCCCVGYKLIWFITIQDFIVFVCCFFFFLVYFVLFLGERNAISLYSCNIYIFTMLWVFLKSSLIYT